MDTTHLTSLLRSLATTPSRRAVARGLTGFALAGALSPLFGFTDIDAKQNKKKKRRRRKKRRKESKPFCAGKDICVDGGEQTLCGDGNGLCHCYVTAETGEPTCINTVAVLTACSECTAEEPTCVDLSGPQCPPSDTPTGCGAPCPNPF